MVEMFTALEVAEMLKVHPKTLARWRRTKIGPKWINVGGLVRYRRDDLDEWLEGAR